jgi:hypothetical protein
LDTGHGHEGASTPDRINFLSARSGDSAFSE